MRLMVARVQGEVDGVYAATFGKVDVAGRRWGHCTRDAGWGLNSQIHVVADGATWIRNQSKEIFGEQESFLLDFFHVSEYLADAGKMIRPHRPQTWLKTQQNRLKRGATEPVMKELGKYRETPEVEEEHAPVRAAHRYLGNRLDQLDYPRAKAMGLPIGSGLIESGHRHVIQARLKIPGAAWLPENAEVMAQMRVVRANKQWKHLWN